MADQMNGIIILKAIPDAGVEKKVGEFLSGRAKNIPADKLKDMIKKTPLVLSKNVTEKIGKSVVSKLEISIKSRIPETTIKFKISVFEM